MVSEIVQKASAVFDIALDDLTKRGIYLRQVWTVNWIYDWWQASRHEHMLTPSNTCDGRHSRLEGVTRGLLNRESAHLDSWFQGPLEPRAAMAGQALRSQ